MGIRRTFQHPQLSPGQALLDNVMLGFDMSARATLTEAMFHAPRSRADERRFRRMSLDLLERVGAGRFAYQLAGSVPYAIQRKTELARVLAGDPSFVLLDEAGAGLNDEERRELGCILDEIRVDGGPGILVIEHNMDLVRQVCDRLIVMNNGSILTEGDVDTVLCDPRVVEVYMGRRRPDSDPVMDGDRA
jgi:ABC-type branched-subunit amino acid transport system ATPase component